MNHVAASWSNERGDSYRYETWETRQGAYRRVALLLAQPFVAPVQDTELVNFLLARGFKVYSIEIPIAEGKPKLSAESCEAAIAGFTDFISKKEGVPIVAFVFSVFCLPFIGMYERYKPEYRSVAFLSPVTDLSIPPFNGSLFLRRLLSVHVTPEMLSASPEELEELKTPPRRTLLLPARLVRSYRTRAPSLGQRTTQLCQELPCAVYRGDADTVSSAEGFDAFVKHCGQAATIRPYPRMKHLLFHDKYKANFMRDLAEFLEAH